MSAIEKLHYTPRKRVDDEIASEITRLTVAGFSLLPLGGGKDGKSPTREFDGRHLNAAIVIGAMRGGSMYGVRLCDLVVVDIDTDTDEARQYVRDRFGESTVQVKTSRGIHHYYEYAGGPLPSAVIRMEGISIDIKSGVNSFVAGPLSYRPDTGVLYDPIVGRLGVTELPTFIDRHHNQFQKADRVKKGMRDDYLFRKSLKLAQCHDHYDEFLADVIAQRDWDIDESEEEFTDKQCQKIANSVWKYKEAGTLYAGTNSTYKADNRRMHALIRMGDNDAFALYHVLVANHGHLNRPFYINGKAMSKSKTMGIGHGRIYDARDTLLKYGIIKKANGYSFIFTDQKEWLI